jgi:hypothetical protein
MPEEFQVANASNISTPSRRIIPGNLDQDARKNFMDANLFQSNTGGQMFGSGPHIDRLRAVLPTPGK